MANEITAAARRYNANGERLWNGKTAEQFSNTDVQSFMDEVQKVLSRLDRQSLPASDVPMKGASLERAKELIDQFCKAEYLGPAEFDNLGRIPIGYTTLTNNDIPIQVYADLVHYRIERYLDGQALDCWQYNSLDDLIKSELEGLSFDDLVSVPDSAIERWAEREHCAAHAGQHCKRSASQIDTVCSNAMARSAKINATNSAQSRKKNRGHEIEMQGE